MSEPKGFLVKYVAFYGKLTSLPQRPPHNRPGEDIFLPIHTVLRYRAVEGRAPSMSAPLVSARFVWNGNVYASELGPVFTYEMEGVV